MSVMFPSVVFSVMATPLNVGLIGAGPWAKMVTGPLMAAGPATRVTGVWSRTAEHAQELAGLLDVKTFGSPDEVIDASDVVAIALAPDVQPEFAVRAARAGKALLLEKPLGADVAGARAIVDAVEAAGVGAVVMLSNRFNPALDEFAVAAAATEPYGGRGCFLSGAFLGGPFAYGWRLERGAVLDIGPHLLDLLEVGLGPIAQVRAAGDPLGLVQVVCTHESGAVSGATMCCRAATESRTEIEVFGPKGSATYDGRLRDEREWAAAVVRAVVGAARGEAHPANVQRALHLQELIAEIEGQL
jgi:predicted dehydrogenase